MRKQLRFYVSFENACAIVNHCERVGMSPLQVLLIAAGAGPCEPYTFQLAEHVSSRDFKTWEDIEQRRPQFRTAKGHQNRVYLDILSQLLKWNEVRVSEVLLKTHGRSRVYFSKSRQEILESGNNVEAKMIPGTQWFACTHLSSYQKQDILQRVLRAVGFSPEYSSAIGWLPHDKQPRIGKIEFVAAD